MIPENRTLAEGESVELCFTLSAALEIEVPVTVTLLPNQGRQCVVTKRSRWKPLIKDTQSYGLSLK